MKNTPKFKVGDQVTHKPDLYGERESKVIEIERFFQTDRHSSVYREKEAKSMRKELNARIEEIDGVSYFIHDGDPKCDLKPRKAPFAGFIIVTLNDKMSTMWNERSLKLKQ